jgi:hypothetical protein
MVTLDPESLASVAMHDLGREIEELIPSARLPERTEAGPLAAYHVSQKISRAGVR